MEEGIGLQKHRQTPTGPFVEWGKALIRSGSPMRQPAPHAKARPVTPLSLPAQRRGCRRFHDRNVLRSDGI